MAAPDFTIRKDATAKDGYRWVHIGNNEHYIALQEPHLDAVPEHPKKTYKNFGVNHLGLVVKNLSEIEEELVHAGYKRGINVPPEQFRKRLYFYDSAGFEWALIEYYSNLPSEKFLYEHEA